MTARDEEERTPWHAMSGQEALERLDASQDGLGADDARERLERYGPNRLQQDEGTPWWRRLLGQFNNVLMLILIVAAVASLFLGKFLDASAILGVVIIIALIGFIQEGKAEKALDSIRDMLSPKAKALRDGHQSEIDAEELVPGDIVRVEGGDRVPADIRLLDSNRLEAEEAALTGESTPVDKSDEAVDEEADLAERSSMLFAGTIVAKGTATGVVVQTGSHTEIGRISEMLRGVEQLQTPLVQQLDRAGRILAFCIVGAAFLTGAFGVLMHDQPWADMFMAGVGLAVAAIPEGLPAIVTISLALGVQSMANKNAIVRRLPAVETLGSISTIFSDKTGTLTRNEMTAQAIWLPEGEFRLSGIGFAPEGKFHLAPRNGTSGEHDEQERHGKEERHGEEEDYGEEISPEDYPALTHFLQVGALCNDAEPCHEDEAWSIAGDPTEGALVVAAAKAGFDTHDLNDEHPREDEIPFDSERKYMATLNDLEGKRLLLKGAPDRLLDMCEKERGTDGDTELDRDAWEERIHELSSRGLRVLALAEKEAGDVSGELEDDDVEHGLTLLGLVGLLDPPREAAIEAVANCQKAGIRPVMVTGDHAVTATAIADQLGFARTERALSGHEIEAMGDEELEREITEVDVYARAAPEHKLRLVQAMQARGGICAMTGDGVNDGPALKRADVGVAMGVQGTEAAKEAAEMVLTDDNFATIVAAVGEGRKVYDNIRKTTTFILPTNGAESLAILLAILAGITLPITGLQVLWVNMITAVTLGIALVFEHAEDNVMERKPRDPHAPLLDLFMLWRVIFVSILLVVCVFAIFSWILYGQGGSAEQARSGAVNMLVAGEIAYLINSRYLLNNTLSLSGLFGSRPVLLAIALVVVVQLGWTYLPFMQLVFGIEGLTLSHWGAILVASIAVYLIVEAEKWVLRRRQTHTESDRVATAPAAN
ncbi:HAD-IC family P-type ATPase [Halomonas sp. MCCC 1A11036]|uniref:HAD-IC family P-type ATPase n=1 Tax=Billgrantia zhangzhouensis TaxID=2733481 RepID=A0ABS9ABY0_9GAMM|nr:HAD-IC family P-type ATPase [Halomonas zhangzhouensis]MCE8019214.1 HAD-IC family P-type ATPase [Halomonas zhangzhouensis]